jgi:NAD(P)H-dependent FMN reductase
MLIASPEYNTAVSAVLKNAIDWASRAEPGDPAHVAFKGKIGGLMSASPGNYGGVRSLAMLRAILAHLGVIVVPAQLSVARANEAFDADGDLRDKAQGDAARSIGAEVVRFAGKLG